MFGGLRQHSFPFCGLYYVPDGHTQRNRTLLPEVHVEAHAAIFETTSRVTITRTFVNPSTTKGIREAHYVFPLLEGISVVGFTCHVVDRVIVGEVKEKHEAKHDYTEAVARGKTAGLFEQLDTSDTFKTSVGNVPPGGQVDIKIIYLGELKHDMEVDGIRFTIPSVIMVRYGRTAPGFDAAFERDTSDTRANQRGIAITVDAEMSEGSFIQKILSPSHPISVSMGTTSIAPNGEPKLSKASATLGIESVRLDKDFILQIVAKNTGVPKAILETHPTIPNQRALMATLVPKFALPAENPEIVFVCDRSGSMGGTNIALVKQALQVFLKSLPVGAMFNICSFGSSFTFLWPRSVSYNQQTLDEAVAHVNGFDANYGGTEMVAPIVTTIDHRYQDMPLEVMLLTDGSIWNQDSLFSYLNKKTQEAKVPIRLFSLGIGSGASSSLIEGIARAGNGFSQSVVEGENMDSKVVRMLKGALSPHVNDYTLEVKYDGIENDSEDDDFEIVEKVADSLKVKLELSNEEQQPKPMKPISLFDPSADPDKTHAPASSMTGESRYAHLPKVAVPNVIQAPQRIPPLFAFSRTTVYLLLDPDSPRHPPKSVVLRGTSSHGPLELEFPVQVLEQPGETIHQLAVKKATYELEQGRGWLSEATDETGKALKERYEGRFSSMVEREAVRLGVQFQVSGKWCSFAAVEKGEKSKDEKEKKEEDWEWLEEEEVPTPTLFGGASAASTLSNQGGALFGSGQSGSTSPSGPFGSTPGPSQGPTLFGNLQSTTSAFGGPRQPQPRALSAAYGGSSPAQPHIGRPFQSSTGVSLFGQPQPQPSAGLFGSSSGTTAGSKSASKWKIAVSRSDPSIARMANDPQPPPPPPPTGVAAGDFSNATPDEFLAQLIKLQTFEGSWDLSPSLVLVFRVPEAEAEERMKTFNVEGVGKKEWATALAVVYMEVKLAKLQARWELVVDKARGWLERQVGEEKMEEVLGMAKAFLAEKGIRS